MLQKEVDGQGEEQTNELEDGVVEGLDHPISREEVLTAIRKLQTGKSPGPDGMISEFFKYSGDGVVDYLLKLFNVLFDSGVYPKSWTESVILPLFKKGDINDTNNYRGISLCDIGSKLYSTVINNRLQRWIEINYVTGEH